MYLKITHVNMSKGFRYADYTRPVDPEDTTKKKLFASLMKDYGRPISKVYVGETTPIPVGWVFQKRETYDDCNETFLQETWVCFEETKTKALDINNIHFGE